MFIFGGIRQIGVRSKSERLGQIIQHTTCALRDHRFNSNPRATDRQTTMCKSSVWLFWALQVKEMKYQSEIKKTMIHVYFGEIFNSR